MSPRKINKAFALAGITMPSVIEHITRNMQPGMEIIKTMTAKQISAVIKTHHIAYLDGKSSAGAEVIDDCVYVDKRLIPIAAIRQIQGTRVDRVTTYSLDYTERV